MATATIGTAHAAARQQWLDELFLRHLNNNDFAPLMGEGADAVIRILNVANKDGDTFKYHFSDFLSASAGVVGDTAMGNGQEVAMTTDQVTIDRRRVPVSIENFAMSDQRTIVDMEREIVMPQLEEWMKSNVQKVIYDALLSTSVGRSSARYLYGASSANFNATHATALANVDNTNDKLTLALIGLAARKAKLEGAGNGRLKPAKLKLKDGRFNEYEYVLLAHSYAVRDLKADSNFANRITYREAQQFDVINGATFVGKHEGVLIYETLNSNMLETNTNTVQCAQNLLLGAGAGVMAYGNVAVPMGASNYILQKKAKALVTTQVTDHAGDVEYGITYVGGAKKLVNSSSETNGVVSLFTAAVAD
jgi:N4-gp56 family major capsid protein